MIPAIGALLLTRSLPRITEFEDLFQQMSIPEIVKFIEGHIRDKNPTTLYYICHIPDQKLERITEIEGFSEALRLCEKDDHIRLFFEVATPKKLTVLTHLPIGGESLMKILKLPIQKANHPLSKECRQKIILLPPLALLIAWQADMPIFFLSKYFSPKQLRFMARYAPSRFVEQMIDFFKSENFSVKLYTLLNALPADVADAFSTGSYTLKQYSIRFNEEIGAMKASLEKQLLDVKAVVNTLEKRRTKSGALPDIPLSLFMCEKDEAPLKSLQICAARVLCLIFDASVAAFKNHPKWLATDLTALDRLARDHVTFPVMEDHEVKPEDIRLKV